MKECLSALPGAPNVGEWYVERHSTLEKVRTLGAREHSLHFSIGLVRNLAKHCNGDTESLPRFRPPCGVTPYSCFSDRLHCVGYNTRLNNATGRLCQRFPSLCIKCSRPLHPPKCRPRPPSLVKEDQGGTTRRRRRHWLPHDAVRTAAMSPLRTKTTEHEDRVWAPNAWPMWCPFPPNE